MVGILQNYGTISISITNNCGTTVVNKPVSVKYCGASGPPAYTKANSTEPLKDQNSLASNIQVEIFPNPAKEIINVITDRTNPETKISIAFITQDGKMVKEITGYGSSLEIDIRDLSSGFHILKCDIEGLT